MCRSLLSLHFGDIQHHSFSPHSCHDYCLECFVDEHVITVTYRWGCTIIIIYLLTFDISMLSRGSHYWTDDDLLFCSQPVSAGQMGWGGRDGKPGRYRWPSSPPHQLHQQHATRIMGPTNPLLWQELTCPQAPQNNRVHSLASCVKQPAPLARWSLNKFSASHWETSRSLGLWHFINNGINNCCWGKTFRRLRGKWKKVLAQEWQL